MVSEDPWDQPWEPKPVQPEPEPTREWGKALYSFSRGEWVAVSTNGRQIPHGANTLEALKSRLEALGYRQLPGKLQVLT